MMQGTDGQCRNKHVRKKLRNSHSYEACTPTTPAEGSTGFTNVMSCQPNSISSFR